MSMLKSNWGVGWSASEAIHSAVLMKQVILGETSKTLRLKRPRFDKFHPRGIG